MSEADDFLLDALDALTLPKRVRFIQFREDGSTLMQTSTHDSLLTMLGRARAGGIGSHAGAADSGPKWPINSGALMLYTEIERAAADWFLSLGGRTPYSDPAQNLRQWFVAWRAHHGYAPGDVEEEKRAARKLAGWAYRIETMFDPPNRLELTQRRQVPIVDRRTGQPVTMSDGTVRTRWATVPAACPECHESSAHDPSTGDKITALGLTYRLSDGADLIAKSAASCAFCGATWVGEERLEWLSTLLTLQGVTPVVGVGV